MVDCYSALRRGTAVLPSQIACKHSSSSMIPQLRRSAMAPRAAGLSYPHAQGEGPQTRWSTRRPASCLVSRPPSPWSSAVHPFRDAAAAVRRCTVCFSCGHKYWNHTPPFVVKRFFSFLRLRTKSHRWGTANFHTKTSVAYSYELVVVE